MDGKPLGEKNPKWLQDDYVKFIRFAQWKIEQAREGVLGFITNHSYLDNPTFRGMRQSLMQSFEQIYLLDLHGNTLKRERCPDGSKDENVFDIRQGVAIGLFIKKLGLKRKICHADLWGLRDDKYRWLEENDIAATGWTEIHPKSPFYLFIPRDEVLLDRYQKYPKITGIFPVNSVGVVTSRDHFVIDFDRETLKRRIRMFRDKKLPDELIRETFNVKDNRDWKMPAKRKAIIADASWEDKLTQILYRPFDVRWMFYHKDAIDFGRPEVMHNMLWENTGLITLRKGLPGYDYTWFFISSALVGHGVFYNGNQSTEYFYPLYLYPEAGKKDLLTHSGKPADRKPNLDPSLLQALKEAYGYKATPPEEVFYYIYAVLYSPTYRAKYAEFLKTDFPRIPFTRDRELFLELGRLGQRLVDLHLLKSPELDPPIARFQGVGENRVEKQQHNEGEKRVYINKTQYFEGVEPEVWVYQIGGYQVLDKWLKDRKGRLLSLEDIRRYCRIVTAIAKTIEIQAKIDPVYPEAEKNLIVI